MGIYNVDGDGARPSFQDLAEIRPENVREAA